MTDKVQKIREVIEKRYEYWREKEFNSHSIESEIRMSECQHLLLIIDSLQEEPSKFDAAIQEGDDVRYNEDLGCRVNLSQLKRAAKREESVSKELEKAANEWDAKASFTPFYMTLDDNGNPNGVKQDYTTHAESFKTGAKWQKEKDDEEKVLTYKQGFEDCKKQMIAKAIDADCFGFQGAALFSFRLPADKYLVGSKIKVIVIKED